MVYLCYEYVCYDHLYYELLMIWFTYVIIYLIDYHIICIRVYIHDKRQLIGPVGSKLGLTRLQLISLERI